MAVEIARMEIPFFELNMNKPLQSGANIVHYIYSKALIYSRNHIYVAIYNPLLSSPSRQKLEVVELERFLPIMFDCLMASKERFICENIETQEWMMFDFSPNNSNNNMLNSGSNNSNSDSNSNSNSNSNDKQ